MRFWDWVRGRPTMDEIHDADQRELEELRRQFLIKAQRTEALRRELLKVERVYRR